jgi:hypothetical protein
MKIFKNTKLTERDVRVIEGIRKDIREDWNRLKRLILGVCALLSIVPLESSKAPQQKEESQSLLR